MRVLEIDDWRLLLPDGLSEEEGVRLFHAVQRKEYELVKVLKTGSRSEVSRIDLLGRDLILKVPTEKNRSAWIQMTTLYREGEAFKNLKAMQDFKQKALASSEPVMAAERRVSGKVVDSWLLYGYIDGEPCLSNETYHPLVVDKLIRIHEAGYLHGDAQIRNFLYKEGEIFSIDISPQKTGLTGFSKAYEFVYLQRSIPGIEKYYGDIAKTSLYRLASGYDKTSMRMNRMRKELLRKIGLRS